MVVSRNDSKRRKKEGNTAHGSPKRTKVHAQRKFAQGSQLNSPSLTPVKDKDKGKQNGSVPPPDLLPIKRPKTEEFVNFLCFRGSDMLPKSLEFFNEPSIPEPIQDAKHDVSSAGPSRPGRNSDQAGGSSKADSKARGKQRSAAAVQALKKKYQEQRLARGKIINKLTTKVVKGKNTVRTRSAGPADETVTKKKPAQSKKPVKSARLVTSIKAKMAAKRKPLLRKHAAPTKRFVPKANNRGGLRSGGELPPGSDLGIKTDRKPRKIIPIKKQIKVQKLKKNVVSRLSDFSSEDEQPLVKKQQVLPKKSTVALRTTRSGLALKAASSKVRRPTRKTKEAATLFMEMMGKDLRSPEEEENVDEMSVDESVEDSTPKRTVSDRKQKELAEKKENEDISQSKLSRKDKLVKSGVRQLSSATKKAEVKIISNSRKAVIERAKLKTKILRRNSNRLVKKELELQRNRIRNLPKRPVRSVPKPTLKDIDSNESNSEEEEEEEEEPSRDVAKDKIVKKDSSVDSSNRKSDRLKSVKSPSIESASKISQTSKSIDSTFNDSDEEPLRGKIESEVSKNVSDVKDLSSEKKTRSGQIRTEVPSSTRSKVSTKDEIEINSKSNKNLEETPKVVKKVQLSKSEGESEEKVTSKLVQNKGKRKVDSALQRQLVEEKKQTESSNKRIKIKEDQKESSCVSKQEENEEQKEPNDLKESKKKPKEVKNVNIKSLELQDKTLEQKKVITKKTRETNEGEKDNQKTTDVKKEISPPKVTRRNSKPDIHSVVHDDNSKSEETIKNLNQSISYKNLPVTKSKIEENVSLPSTLKKKEENYIQEKDKSKLVTRRDETKPQALKNKPLKNDEKFDASSKSKVLDSSPRQGASKRTVKKDANESKIAPSTMAEKIVSTSITVSEGEKSGSKDNAVATTVKEASTENNTVTTEVNTVLSPPLLSNPSKIKEQHAVEVTKASSSISQENSQKTTLTKLETSCTDPVQSANQRTPVDSNKSDNSISVNQNLVTSVLPKNRMKRTDTLEVKSLPQSPAKSMVKSPAHPVTEKKLPTVDIASLSKAIESVEKKQAITVPKENINSSEVNLSSLKPGTRTVELSSNTTENKTESITIPIKEVQFSKRVNHLSEENAKCEQNLELHKVLTDVHQQVEAFTSDKLPHTMDASSNLEVLCLSTPITSAEQITKQTSPFNNPVTESNVNLTDQVNFNMRLNHNKDIKTEERKSILKSESSLESRMKLDSSEMSEKIYSAIDSLMSLKNLQKSEERPEFLYPSMSNLKVNKVFESEPKRHLVEPDLKRFGETDSKRSNESGDIKRVKFQDPVPDQAKRISVQEHEPKRVTIIEPEVKRAQMPEVDFRRFQVQDNKLKLGPPQVVKGCANPKSMLKPGTLIDIAGISHSPDIMAPLRPGVEGEIIPMNRPVRVDMQDPYRMPMPGAKPYEPKLDQQFYNYRRPTLPLNEKGVVKVETQESAEAKAKVPVNESAWRLAFKNVKDPKSNANSPAENPVDRKNLSVNALAKRHTIKSKFEGKEKVSTTPQQPVPFLRQTKPFPTLSTSKTKPSTIISPNKAIEAKKSTTNIDPSVLREKEAEITDFVRQMYVEKEMGKPFVPVVIPQVVKESENQVSSPKLEENTPSQHVPSQSNQTTQIVNTTNLIQYQQITSQSPSQSNSISSNSNFSPYKKKEESFFKFGGSEADNTAIVNQGNIQKQNQLQTSLVPLTIKYISPKFVDGSGNKYLVPADASNTQIINAPKIETPHSPTQSVVSSTQVSQQFPPSDNIFKQIQPTRHLSPTRTQPTSSAVEDNLFKESNMPKRTKSPLSYPQPSARSNSPQSNLGKRNTSSPIQMRPSRNIFKEVVPATRSFSPTSSNASQAESDAPGNIFSQNSPFKRSISPLCNKPATSSSVSSNVAAQDPTGISKSVVQVPLIESGFVAANPAQVGLFIHQQLSTLAATAIMQSDMLSNSKQSVLDLPIKKEPIEPLEVKISNSGSHLEIKNKSQVMQPVKTTQGSISRPQEAPTEDNKLFKLDVKPEVKPSVPLTVEQTLKQPNLIKLSPSETILSPAKSNVTDLLKSQDINKMESTVKDVLNSTADLGNIKTGSKNANASHNKQLSSIYNRECELDLMSNKKVNMSAEEIKRWLNESSNSVIEHRANCGILENNSCECEHKIIDAQHNIDMMKSESVVKAENVQAKSVNMSKDVPKSSVTRSVTVKEELAKVKEVAPILNEVSKSLSTGQFESGNSKKLLNDSKDSGNSTIKSNVCTPNKSSDSIATEQNTPPNKRTSRQDQNIDFSEVSSPPLRDDVSSNISSSNDETPDKFLHPERRSIFHQRRLGLKVKERRELIAPSKNAFSPENESSVYAFEPDLPPASTPFRRSKPKDGKSTSTVVMEEDENAPSSNSIAVQVNFDNEAVLECSTQTDTQEADDDDTHTFYIPLQQNTADTTKPPMIQGVAVKLDTEGPDQKVIMRAKLVTKPLSTFNQSTSAPGRSLMGPRSGGKPEQKVRPLSVKPPIGTVQPTARPKPKPTTSVKEEEPGPSTSKAACSSTSPQATRLAKRLKNKSLSSSDNSAPKVAPAKLVEAPTFYPTEKEFEDPLEYINKITPEAEKYGLCRVVPPKNFKPECKVSDDMRFTAYNQYIHKMLHRWGPNVKEMLAIKKYLATYKITLTSPPLIGGMEVDLPRLYQTVQQFGGLKEVIEKKRWQKVAESLKLPKSSQDRVTKLDDIYCKFLLPYDTLSHQERTKLFEEVEKDWIEREKKVTEEQDTDDESDDESDIDECIVKGRSMALNAFFRVARNTMSMWFPKTETPSAGDVELEFWKHVASRQHHVCVHAGSIDTGSASYGFPTGKNSTTSRHPWNLKMLTNNAGSILRFLGPIMGVTVPTLHVGMLFSACCWYRDPHGLAWIEYLHTGASKIWYGIPDSSSAQFRSAVTSLVPRLCQDKQLWLASDTAMVPPPLLVERGVSLSRIVQEPGQFIIVFPKAYTSNICTGYVVSESVYFAQPSWLTTAQNLFYEMRESCEPTVFSLEKLLFSIVNDSRSSTELLNQLLPIVVSLRDGEVAGRRQLEELGLNASERLNSKGRKSRFVSSDDEEDYECEKCRTNLFISFMSNSHDNSVYCLPHAVELLTHKRNQVKHCTLVYSFSEDELEELVEKLKSRAENKSQKKIQAKSSKS